MPSLKETYRKCPILKEMLSVRVGTRANLKYLHCKCSSLNDSNTKAYKAKK